jgi:hypothetical protein
MKGVDVVVLKMVFMVQDQISVYFNLDGYDYKAEYLYGEFQCFTVLEYDMDEGEQINLKQRLYEDEALMKCLQNIVDTVIFSK